MSCFQVRMSKIPSQASILLKLHYFLFFAGLACVMPILPVYCHQLGLSHSAVSLVYTVLPFTVILVKPIVGNVADWLQAHKFMFLVGIFLTAVSYYAMNFIPEFGSSNKSLSTLYCNIDKDALNSCDEQVLPYISNNSELPLKSCDSACNFNFSIDFCSLFPNISTSQEIQFVVPFNKSSANSDQILVSTNNSLQSFTNSCSFVTSLIDTLNICLLPTVSCKLNCLCTTVERVNNHSMYTSLEFILLFCLMILSLDAAGFAIGLGDTIVVDIIKETNSDFGYQRVFGTIGWGLFCIIAGKIFDTSSIGLNKTNYSIGFHMLLGLLLLDILICLQVKVIKQPKPVKILGNIITLYKNPNICLFTFAVFIIGIMTGTLWTFLFIYIEEHERNPLLLGLISGVQCFGGELPFFLISGWIVKKIGHLYCMSLCLICYGIRFIYYSIINNPWIVLPMEISNGVTFGVFFAAMVSFAALKAPLGMSATMQNLLQSVFEGLGTGLGSLIAGMLYSSFGGRRMFLIMGIASLVLGVLYTVAVVVVTRIWKSIPEHKAAESQDIKLSAL